MPDNEDQLEQSDQAAEPAAEETSEPVADSVEPAAEEVSEPTAEATEAPADGSGTPPGPQNAANRNKGDRTATGRRHRRGRASNRSRG